MRNEILSSIVLVSIFTTSAFSHGTEKHDDKKETPKKIVEKLKDDSKKISIKDLSTKKVLEDEISNLQKTYKEINKEYVKNIKPIFQAKCFNCHSNTISYPIYYKIPGIKGMIDNDIKEAKKHIDFSNDFPFISHETPINDIKSLKKIALKGGMPPLKYIIGHWNSKLTKEDNKAILKWTNKAISSLEKRANDK